MITHYIILTLFAGTWHKNALSLDCFHIWSFNLQQHESRENFATLLRERERERKRERVRQTDRQTDRQSQTDRHRETESLYMYLYIANQNHSRVVSL